MAADFSRRGSAGIWFCGLAVAVCLVALIALLGLIAWQGLGHFWPNTIVQFEFEGEAVLGEIVETERLTREQYLDAHPTIEDVRLASVERTLVKTANRRTEPPEFRWFETHRMTNLENPRDAAVIERAEWGHAFGYIAAIFENGQRVATADPRDELGRRLARADALRRDETEAVERLIDANARWEAGVLNRSAATAAVLAAETRLTDIRGALERDSIEIVTASGSPVRIALADALRIWRPNEMSWIAKARHFLTTTWRFLSDDPREANTEGGVFPALFGTVLMVILMSVLVTPLGVLTAVYLHDYARPGLLVTTLRIAINNLAGVPSIVFGVFGLGFSCFCWAERSTIGFSPTVSRRRRSARPACSGRR